VREAFITFFIHFELEILSKHPIGTISRVLFGEEIAFEEPIDTS